MNTRTLTALAVAAGLISFTAGISNAADGPLSQFGGNFTGSGKIVVQNGSSERIRCRATNKAEGKALTLSLRCASDSYKFELASDVGYDEGNISGSWNETTRGVIGSLSGKMSGGSIQATASAVGFTASLSIRSVNGALNVSIKSPGSEISDITVSMARGH